MLALCKIRIAIGNVTKKKQTNKSPPVLFQRTEVVLEEASILENETRTQS